MNLTKIIFLWIWINFLHLSWFWLYLAVSWGFLLNSLFLLSSLISWQYTWISVRILWKAIIFTKLNISTISSVICGLCAWYLTCMITNSLSNYCAWYLTCIITNSLSNYKFAPLITTIFALFLIFGIIIFVLITNKFTSLCNPFNFFLLVVTLIIVWWNRNGIITFWTFQISNNCKLLLSSSSEASSSSLSFSPFEY